MILRELRTTFDRRTMSPDVRNLLDQEERNGERTTNRIRYAFAFLLLLAAVASRSETGNRILNFSLVAIYVLATLAHTLLLRKNAPDVVFSVFKYLGIVLDYTLITFAILYYTIIYSPDNFSFAIKNPLVILYMLPLALTATQFRWRLVLLSLGVLLSIYYAFVIITLRQDVQLTVSWPDYVLGKSIILSDVLVTRVIPFLAVALVLVYTIYRALYMVQRIARIEQQKSSLARYFSPDVVEDITSNPDVLRRGGRQPVTILFMDIRGFTSMSEKMSSEELADFLSVFRERMAQAIFDNNGTLDKFVGDAIMATFGTPRPSPEPGRDAGRALAAARSMLKNLDDLNRERAGRGQAPIRIGIGLHSGDVFAGNVGSGNRLEYTVIGDAVNTASRIESLCKKLNASLLISEEVYQATGCPADAEKMPRVRVRGKEEPLQVYRLAVLPGAG